MSLNLEKQMHFEGFSMFENVVSQGVSSPDFFSPELFSSVLNQFQHTYIRTCSDKKYRKKYILAIRIVLYLKYLALLNRKLKWDCKSNTEHHHLRGGFNLQCFLPQLEMGTRQICLPKPRLTGKPSLVEGTGVQPEFWTQKADQSQALFLKEKNMRRWCLSGKSLILIRFWSTVKNFPIFEKKPKKKL